MTFPVYPLPSGLALLPVPPSGGPPMCLGLMTLARLTLIVHLWILGIANWLLRAVADTNPAFGMQLLHPRFLEFIGAPESARLLYCSATFWVQHMGEEDAVAAAMNLQRDARVMLSNL